MARGADDTSRAGDRARVVWACPDPAQREQIARDLAESVEVIAVADGAAALQAVREHLADLVLSAVAMPHLDGLGLLATLRADPAANMVPVIFIAEHADSARARGDAEMKADDYLVHPVSSAELNERVRTHLVRSHVRRAEAIERAQAEQE